MEASATVQKITRPKLEVMITQRNGVAFTKAFEKAQAENRIIASNKRMDAALVGSDEWKSVKEVFACWTGTMAAYGAPGKKFGKEIVYTDPETKQRYVFPVNEEHRGEKNAILAINHQDFKMDYDGKDIVVIPEAGKAYDLLIQFPIKDGWYVADEKYGIPVGKETSSENPEARYLVRVDGAGRIGPVARGSLLGWGLVLLGGRPSLGLGVAVEAPDASFAASKTAPIIRGVEQSGGGAPLEAAKLRITQEGQRLVVEGTPEQLQAALKLLEQLKQ